MRFLVKVKPAMERLNRAVEDGTFASKVQQILSELKPEAAYFLEEDGRRTAILVVDIPQASDMPKVGEPFYLGLHAEVCFHPVMTAQDLLSANLSGLSKKWTAQPAG